MLLKTSSIYINFSNDRNVTKIQVGKGFSRVEDSFDTSLYCEVQLNGVVHEPNDLNGCRDYSRGPAEN